MLKVENKRPHAQFYFVRAAAKAERNFDMFGGDKLGLLLVREGLQNEVKNMSDAKTTNWKFGTLRGYALTVAILSCIATITTFSMTYFGSDGAFPRGLCTMSADGCVPSIWKALVLNATFATTLFAMFLVPYALVAAVFKIVDHRPH